MKRERGEGGLFLMKGSKKWYAQYYDANGRPCRVSTRTEVKQEAIAFLRKLMADADRGLPFEGDVRKVRYADIREALIQNYIERGNRSLETYADGEYTIWGLKDLDEFFGDPGPAASSITTDTSRQIAAKLLAAGKSNGTVNRSLALLRRMLNIAKEDGKLLNVPKIRMLKAGAPRKGFIEQAKFNELLSHIPINLKPLVVFLYYCGVRCGEACQIEWSQVDLAAAVIRLEGEQTKNADARTVPLPDVLIAMLERREPKEGLVFSATNLRKEWQRACAACGLGTLTDIEDSYDQRYTGLLPHDLRRSAVRNLVRAGVPERVAMSISGHKTRAVFDRYNITSETDVVDAMRRVQNRVSESSVRVARGRRRQAQLTR
jgi:integrase